MATIELRGIHKGFGSTAVLRGVSLTIRDGEFVSLVGPSGCGKTTLLRILAGLETADDGRIAIAGLPVEELAPHERDVAMVFQSYALYPYLTVAENIAVPLSMRRLTPAQRLPLLGGIMPGSGATRQAIAAEVRRVAALLQIEPLLDRKPGQLSGGQRQRVALARAMVRNPAAFLMDEPLSNLDAKLRVQMRAEISQLHRRLGATFVYVTHDQAEAMTMSDRIAVMQGGEILQCDTPDRVYAEPEDVRVAELIGAPKINVLAPGRAPGLPDGVRLAFRPEAAALAGPGQGGLAGRVVHVENYGADCFVHAQSDAAPQPLIIRTAPGDARPRLGENIGISVPNAAMLAFGSDNKRVRALAA